MRGYIEKRGASWSAIVDLPPDPTTGKRRRKRVTAATKREVEALIAATIQAAQGGFVDAGRTTVRDYLARWLEAAASGLRPATHRRYADLVRLHVVPVLGGVRLGKLSAADVQWLYADRPAAGLSPTSVRHVHGVLHRALDQAVRWGLLVRNPTDAVAPPRRGTPDVATWDAGEVATVLACAAGADLEALWRLALLTGMRRGEILGLLWRDVDLDRGTVAVRRTLSHGSRSALEPDEPKTASGRRQISIPASVVESLRRHRVRQLEHRLAAGVAYDDKDRVFANDVDRALHPNSLALRFRRLTERAGVPPIRFHDLRHTCATLLLAEGVHPKVVQERLGHADIAMTMNLYSHVTASTPPSPGPRVRRDHSVTRLVPEEEIPQQIAQESMRGFDSITRYQSSARHVAPVSARSCVSRHQRVTNPPASRVTIAVRAATADGPVARCARCALHCRAWRLADFAVSFPADDAFEIEPVVATPLVDG